MDKIELRSLQEDDQERMISLFYNKEIKKTYLLPDFQDLKQAIHLFERMYQLSYQKDRYVRGIYLNQLLIGWINDTGINENEIEVGYVIDPVYQNYGYMSKALKLAIDELFQNNYQNINAAFFEENIASKRVLEKCGFKPMNKEESIEYHHSIHLCIYYSRKKME